jgi:pre-mRNA-splicing factor ATP-dependent RNA helicase DHX38/PRP16
VDADDFTDQDGNLSGGGVFKSKYERLLPCVALLTLLRIEVPALPIKKDNIRVKGAETPSHAGGISATARERLQERLKARNMPSNLTGGNANAPQIDSRSRPQVEHRGLGDFQSRLNKGYNREDQNRPRERDQGYGGGNAGQQAPGKGRNWDEGATPRSTRTNRDDGFGGSMRIPNTAWDETPRVGDRGEGGSSESASFCPTHCLFA